MERRSFLKKVAAGLFGFAVLPPATTYDRVWRVKREIMPWDEGPYKCVMENPKRFILHSEIWEIEWSDVVLETFDGVPLGTVRQYKTLSHSVTP